jgi:MerR family transcriptional regulator, light-induced transcriptional regulator
MPTLADLPDTPKFRIASVCAQTGIQPVTLRAWERRYTFLNPRRTGSNYRLYSERDVALLCWVKQQVDAGQPIGQLAADVQERRRTGRWPDLPATAPKPDNAEPPLAWAARLYAALTTHAEQTARQILDEAEAAFDVSTVCTQVIAPCLVQIGVAWERGELRIATEHFASNFLRGHLLAIFQTMPVKRGAARILVGATQGELHDIGSLMFALLLRRDGHQVEFLGPDVPIEDLLAYARETHPTLICLAATAPTTAQSLRHMTEGLAGLRPRPRFGFGGAAFVRHPELRTTIPGIFLGETVLEARLTVRKLVGP